MIEENKEKESNQEAEANEEVKAEEAPKAEEAEEAPKAEEAEEAPKAEEAEEAPKAEEAEEAPKAEEAEEAPKAEEAPGKVLNFDEFRPGDNITVNIKIIEGDRQRTQSFQGDVIKGRYTKSKQPDVASTFMVRRIASGVGVERIFPFFTPSIESIKLNRKGKVRQARIYYMRNRSGKRARIKERRN